MGRWTRSHYDAVLIGKVENLVRDAIKSSKQSDVDEKNKLPYSYESFVENLDDGDSFTATLIGILVRELADRQTRQNEDDKRRISTQTAHNLQSLSATDVLNYSNNRSRRQGMPWAFYERDTSDSPDDEEFEEYGVMGANVPEGTRMDSASLYDAYSRPASTGPAVNAYGPYPSTSGPPHLHDRDTTLPYPRYAGIMAQRHLPPPHSQFPTRRLHGGHTTASAPSSAGALLVRSSSIRRPSRSARVSLPTASSAEFENFASRRRSAHRSSATHELPDFSLMPVGSLQANENQPVIPSPSFYGGVSNSQLPRASLFEPPSPPFRGADRLRPIATPPLDTNDSSSQSMYRVSVGNVPFLINGSAEGSAVRVSSSPWRVENSNAETTSSWISAPPPPSARSLRRGGVRPPESLFSTASSAPGAPPSESNLASLLQPSAENPSWLPGNPDTTASSGVGETVSSFEPLVNLPTPRSISPSDDRVPDNATN